MPIARRTLRAMTAIAAIALPLATPTIAAADALVVRSTGPSAATYPVGRRLPPTARIELETGDRVVLVGEGGTRTLSGPGNFPVRAANQASQNRGATLGRYLSTGGGTISRTGAVRGAGADGPSTAPNLWVVDIAHGGNFCVADMASLTLWRADMAEDTLLMVENVATPATQSSLAFVAGQNFRRWPGDTMPVVEGQSYRITGPGLDAPTVISFVALPNPPSEPEAIADALADRGCVSQLTQLGERLAEATGG